MITFTILPRRKPSMTQGEFAAYHREQHAPLFRALPAVRRYVRRDVQCHSVAAFLPGLPPVAFDGVTELWFDDVAGLEATFTPENYMETIRPNEARFPDLHACEFVPSTESLLIA